MALGDLVLLYWGGRHAGKILLKCVFRRIRMQLHLIAVVTGDGWMGGQY